MRAVLVTGASGFIGAHVAKSFAERGFRVVATGRNVAKLESHTTYADCRPCDLVSDDIEPLLRGIDTIVHCAALSSPWGPRDAFHAHNVQATQRLADAALRCSVERFVHLSSPSIYFRFAHQFNVDEAQCPAQFVNDYAQTKREAERVVATAHERGLHTIMLRPRAVYGEGDAAIMPRVLKVARRGVFPLFDSGRAHIDTTYVGNVVEAAWRAAHAPRERSGRVYNITDGASLSVRELLDHVFRALQWRVRFVNVPTSLALAMAGIAETIARCLPSQPEPRLTRYGVGVLAYSQTLNIAAACDELGYRPLWTTAQGIERYAQWYARHAH